MVFDPSLIAGYKFPNSSVLNSSVLLGINSRVHVPFSGQLSITVVMVLLVETCEVAF
jgi:hypothetical protein